MKPVKIAITGGTLRGRKIVSYSAATRPTAQNVKIAVFNMLFNVYGVGLDLFSGSGAYGIEGLSRGLDKAYFNDSDHDAFRSLKENIESLDLTSKAVISNSDYKAALNYYQNQQIVFNVIFLDPPYELSDSVFLEIFTWASNTQPKGLKVVVERDKNKKILEIPGFSLIKNKQYGIKQITIYEKD